MLETAGGVIIGGIVLYILYQFRKILLKTAVWGGLGIGAVWLFGAVLLGGWRTAEHIVNHSKPKATIPEKLFVWVLIFAFFFLISEIKDKFSNTRWFIGLFRRKYNS